MSRALDLRNKQFGRLTAIKRVLPNNKFNQTRWLCKCECGNTKIITTANLRNGSTQSCGCLQKDQTSASNTRHGHATRQNGLSSEYRSWRGMHQRCYNKSNPKYERYGKRGIVVCQQWHGESGFKTFLQDMGERPSMNHSLDRIDNNGNYDPNNCRWTTSKEQSRNRENTLKIDGQPLIEYCEENNLNYHTIMTRIQRGDSIKQAISRPTGSVVSKGAKQLLEIIKKIYPNQRIVSEYNIATSGSLRLDWYMPSLKIAFEYDGEFHYHFNVHYHGTREAFAAARMRDREKDFSCKELGIILVRMAYDEPLEEEYLKRKISESLDV